MKDKEEREDAKETAEVDASVPERERRACCSGGVGVGVGGRPDVGGGRGFARDGEGVGNGMRRGRISAWCEFMEKWEVKVDGEGDTGIEEDVDGRL